MLHQPQRLREFLHQRRLVFVITPDQLSPLRQLEGEFIQAEGKLRTAQDSHRANAARVNQEETMPENQLSVRGIEPKTHPNQLQSSSTEFTQLSNALGLADKTDTQTLDEYGATEDLHANNVASGASITVEGDDANPSISFYCRAGGTQKISSLPIADLKGKQIQVKSYKKGSTVIAVVSHVGGEEICSVLYDETSKTLKGIITSKGDTEAPRVPTYTVGGMNMFSAGSTLITQKSPNAPQLVPLHGAVLTDDAPLGEEIGGVAMTKFKTTDGQELSLGFDRNGNLLRSIKGPKVEWSSQVHHIVPSGAGMVKVYPALANTTGSGEGAEFADPQVAAMISGLLNETKSLLTDALSLSGKAESGVPQILSRADALVRRIPTEANRGTVGELSRVTKNIKTALEALSASTQQRETVRTEQMGRFANMVGALEARLNQIRDLPQVAQHDDLTHVLEQVKQMEDVLSRFNNERASLIHNPHRSGSLGVLIESDLSPYSSQIDRTNALFQETSARLETKVVAKKSAYEGAVTALHGNAEIKNQAYGTDPNTVTRSDIDGLKTELQETEHSQTQLREVQDALKRSSAGSTSITVKRTLDDIDATLSLTSPTGAKLTNARTWIHDLDGQVIDVQKKRAAQQKMEAIHAKLDEQLRRITSRTPLRDIESIPSRLEEDLQDLQRIVTEGSLQRDLEVGSDQISSLRQLIQHSADEKKRNYGELVVADRLRVRRTVEDNITVVLAEINRASREAEIGALLKGCNLFTGEVNTTEAQGKAIYLAEALRAAHEGQDLGEGELLEEILRTVRHTLEIKDALLYEKGFYKRKIVETDGSITYVQDPQGIFGYECPQWRTDLRVDVPKANSSVPDITPITRWDKVKGIVEVEIPGVTETTMVSGKKITYEIPETHRAAALKNFEGYKTKDITTAETVAYRFMIEHFPVKNNDIDWASGASVQEGSLGNELLDLIDVTHVDGYSQQLESVMKFLLPELVKQYGERLMDQDTLYNIAVLVIEFIRTLNDEYFDPNEATVITVNNLKGELEGSSNLENFGQRYQPFTDRKRLNRLDALEQRKRAYENHLFNASGLKALQQANLSEDIFTIGGIQVLRMEEVMKQRLLAKDLSNDVRGYIVIGQPGSGKSRLEKHLQRVEGGKSTWIDGTNLQYAVSWDPWDPKNNEAARRELIKFFVGMTNGWNISIDEAHNLPDELLAQLKLIAQKDGQISTIGSPTDPSEYAFGPVFGAGDYKVNNSSILSLIMNVHRTIGEDGRFVNEENGRRSTLDALGRRLPLVELDEIDYRETQELGKDYLRRGSLADTKVPSSDLILFVEVIYNNQALKGNSRVTDNVKRSYTPAELDIIEKRLKYKKIAVDVLVGVQKAVQENGRGEEHEVLPPCYLTGVGGNDISGLVASIDENNGSSLDIKKLIRKYLIEKHGSSHGPDKRELNILWIEHLLGDGIERDDVNAEGLTPWDLACRHAVELRAMAGMGDQGAKATILLKETVKEAFTKYLTEGADLRESTNSTNSLMQQVLEAVLEKMSRS
jgi:type II secretory pathway predicted ATPase ExeA